jgi:hypothetical protein
MVLHGHVFTPFRQRLPLSFFEPGFRSCTRQEREAQPFRSKVSAEG